MKRILLVIMVLSTLLSLAACGGAPAAQPSAQLPNPVHEVSAEELLETTGMSFTVPEGAENVSYSYIDSGDGSNPIAQMSFTLNGSDCTARVQGCGISGDTLPDISGMFYQWSETAESELGHNSASFYFNPGKEGYVTWYDHAPGLLYSISMSDGASVDALGSLAGTVCPPMQGEADGAVGDGTGMDSMSASYEFYREDRLPITVDLDADGENETISVNVDGDPQFGEHTLIVSSSGAEDSALTVIQFNSTLCLSDIDLDGRFEILFFGDCGSDDYVTYAWRWNGALESIPFAGEVRRWAVADGAEYAPGSVEDIEISPDGNARILLGSFTYMLGTYGSVRPYALRDDGSIAPCDGSMWSFNGNEIWLETAIALPAALDGEQSELAAGTKLLLTGTNGTDCVYFTLEDGRTGTLAVAYSEADYAWTVGGAGENEAFTSLPYAG